MQRVHKTMTQWLKLLNVSKYVGAAGVLAWVGAVQAAPFTDWQHEYTGDEPGTLALWNFNEGAPTADSSNNGHTLNTLEAPAEIKAGGKFGWGLHIPYSTSADAYAQASTSTTLFPSGSNPSLTVELWAKFNSLTNGSMYLIDKRRTDDSGYRIAKIGPTLSFAVGDGTNLIVAAADFAEVIPEADVWYHIAGTWDASDDTARLYVNGHLVGSTVSPGSTIVNNTANFRFVRIGNRLTSNYGSMDGVLDGIRISDVAYQFVPEPGSLSLLGFGATMLLLRRRRHA